MAVITDQAADKLGWNAIRAALADELVSAMGRAQLQALRPSDNREMVVRSLESVSELLQAIERNDLLPLEDFLDIRKTLERAAPAGGWVRGDELEAVRKVCRAARRIRKALLPKSFPVVSGLARRLKVLSELEEHIGSIVDTSGEIRGDASPELRRIRCRRHRLQGLLRDRLRTILQKAVSGGLASEGQLTVRGGRMVIPLRAEAKRKMRGFVHDASATGRTVYLEPAECVELGNDIRLAEAEEAREIERLLREATVRVRHNLPALDTNQTLLGTIDLLQAKARLARRIGGTIPNLQEEPLLDIRNGKNPVLLLHAADSMAVVPLNLTLGGDLRTLVITGPNAGGKTVAMKTAGLMAVMLGCGLPVPVHPASTFGLFRQILVEIGDEQSVEHDLSTFSARVTGLKRMCAAACNGVMLLVDEIGTGTDPAQGAALAQAVLEQFTAQGALTIVTTHHGTLKAYAHEAPGVANGSLSFDEQTMRPTFEFRQGLPGASFAFRIAERMSLKAAIVARARALFGTAGASLEALMETFEALNRQLQDRLASPLKPKQPTAESDSSRPSRSGAYRRPGRARPAPKVTLQPGQWVMIDQGDTPYRILELDRNRAIVSFGNMRLHVNVSRLKPARNGTSEKKPNLQRQPPKARIDMRGSRVRDALVELEQFIDQGLGHSLVNLEIVHGKGTGALREAIHARLKEMDSVASFESPPLNPGVTYVRLG